MRNRSLLTHGMPDSIVVGGVTVPIQTDYRVGILVEAILRDGLLDAGTRAALIFRLYCGEVPEGTEPVLLWNALMDFFAMSREYGEQSGTAGRDVFPAEPIMDFETDGDLILASFLGAYGLDLLKTSMHWWQFLTLLIHLPEESPFMRTVALRTLDLGNVHDEDLRRQLRQARAAVRLPFRSDTEGDRRRKEGPEKTEQQSGHKKTDRY